MTFVNITGLRQTEIALSERNLRMETLLESIPDGYVLIDATGNMLEVNSALGEMLGYPKEELLGESVDKLMYGSDYAPHVTYIEHYLERGVSHVIGRSRPLEARHRDGHPVALEISVAAMHVADRPYFVGLLRPALATRVAADG
jgi:PAS domain S-box-containing protein